jgi:hypothetical protein
MNQRTQPVPPTTYGPPQPKPRSAFVAGFAVAMGVMTAVTIWAVGWAVVAGLFLSVLASAS